MGEDAAQARIVLRVQIEVEEAREKHGIAELELTGFRVAGGRRGKTALCHF
jgi:hypothetical protein